MNVKPFRTNFMNTWIDTRYKRKEFMSLVLIHKIRPEKSLIWKNSYKLAMKNLMIKNKKYGNSNNM